MPTLFWIVIIIIAFLFFVLLWALMFMASECERREGMEREVDLRSPRKDYSSIEGRIKQSYGEEEEE
jgi:hypothetical protein